MFYHLFFYSDGCGTAMYLAPEIASGYTDSTHGYPVDWWSLGCVLFELVTGERSKRREKEKGR